MRDAATVLGIIRARGRRGLPLEDVYRQLFNPDLYLLAYGKIAQNAGALTPGATAETADGMALATIQRIIGLLRQERYRWTPARRVHIPKSNGKTRPLGIPTWSDKLLQEVIRLVLEAYYDPQFSPRSHGFRPGRGCHTALGEIYRTWKGTVWFIEGDIRGCFDSLDHEVLLGILREKIHDNRFLRLIANLLRAGYLDDWTYGRTLSGSPQGGVCSPILANIYLDRLDRFVDDVLIPQSTRGTQRRRNPAYTRLKRRRADANADGDADRARALRRQMRGLPTCDPQDPAYRRLRYVRYADDFLLGFAGPRGEAEAIKRRLGEYLRDTLKLELADAKTLITHGRTGAARFLGYDLVVLHADDRLTKTADGRAVRTLNGRVGLKVPPDVVRAKCAPYLAHGKPIHRAERSNDDAFSIVARYENEYRGVVNYYRMAYNLHLSLIL
jgi:group II intron reverse transcriptase/maturase